MQYFTWNSSTDTYSRPSANVVDNDVYYNHSEIIMTFEGANNSTTFVDEKKHTISSNGSVKITTTEKAYGNSCCYFSAANNSLYFSDLNLGTEAVTIEMWIKTSGGVQYAQLIGNQSSSNEGFSLLINHDSSTDGQIALYGPSNEKIVHAKTKNCADNVWHHVALTGLNRNFTIWIDGFKRGVGTSSISLTSSANTYIGRNFIYSPRNFSGYIDGFRITKGIARYTNNFVPPGEGFYVENISSTIRYLKNVYSSCTFGNLISSVYYNVNSINEFNSNNYVKPYGNFNASNLISSGNTTFNIITSENANTNNSITLSNNSQILIGPSSDPIPSLVISGNTPFNIGILNESLISENVIKYRGIDSNILISNTSSFAISKTIQYDANTNKGKLAILTSNYGYYIDSSFGIANSNYGLYSNLTLAANTWNLYVNGSANNYIKSKLGINTPFANNTLHVAGNKILAANNNSNALKIKHNGTGTVLEYLNGTPDSFIINGKTWFLLGIPSQTNNFNLPFYPAKRDFFSRNIIASNTHQKAAVSIASYTSANNKDSGPYLSFNRSNSVTTGQHSLVTTNQVLGTIGFSGSVGNAYLMGAGIRSEVVATATANSIPANLIFSTFLPNYTSLTATDLFHISSNGKISLWRVPTNLSSASFRIYTPPTTTAEKVLVVSGQIKSPTSNAYVITSSPGIYNSNFRITDLRHYYALQGTYGASSNVTNQYAYYTSSNLTKANNNYGFYSNLIAAANTWSFYGAGNAASYFAGDMRFDKTISTTVGSTTINKNIGTAIIQTGLSSATVINNRVTANSIIIISPSANVSTEIFYVTQFAGQFIINCIPAAVANTSINFMVIN